MTFVLGLDIGGSSLKLGAWEGGKRVYWREGLCLPDESDPEAAVRDVAQLIAEQLAQLNAAPAALGIGSCGLIAHGEILYSPNTPWMSLPLRSRLAELLALPVSVINDADAFLIDALELAEDRTKLCLGITLGTGIGTAVWLGDRLLAGGSGISPEAGHTVYDRDALPAVSGIPGDWEHYASAGGIVRFHRKAGGDGELNAGQIAERALAGEGSAVEAWWRFGMALGTGLASLCNIFSPSEILIGGGLSRSPLLFEDAMHECLSLYMLRQMPRPRIRFVGERADSVARGAALHAASQLTTGTNA